MPDQPNDNIITVDPNFMDGMPCIRGLPVTVDEIVCCILNGMSVEQVLAKYPQLTVDDFKAVVKFVKKLPVGEYFFKALYL